MDRALASTAARGMGFEHISQTFFSPLGGNDPLAELTDCFVPSQRLLGSHFHPKAVCLIFLILRLMEKKMLHAHAGSTRTLLHYKSYRSDGGEFIFLRGRTDVLSRHRRKPPNQNHQRTSKQNRIQTHQAG